MARGRRRAYTSEEIAQPAAANKSADAYNAGYRRGQRGQEPGGRYQFRPEFAEGYRDGQKAACVKVVG